MSLYLAIDAGGTKTDCLLANDTRILARASTGTVKLLRVSEAEATRRLQTMLDQVAAAAQVALAQVTRTCLGLAGLTSPAARAWARQLLPTLVGGDVLLAGDEEIALDAAFTGGPGILVIAGTGSNIVGRTAAGVLVHAGGWGPILGDEGSGYWIGLEALRAALRAIDQEPDREPARDPDVRGLLHEIQRHWKLASLAELVTFANRTPGPDFAALAPIVARCAQAGDAVAAQVLDRAGADLADQVALVWRRMADDQKTGHRTAPPAPLETIPVAFTGSVLAQIPAVHAAMAARLAQTLPTAVLAAAPVDPLDGALWRARHSPPNHPSHPPC